VQYHAAARSLPSFPLACTLLAGFVLLAAGCTVGSLGATSDIEVDDPSSIRSAPAAPTSAPRPVEGVDRSTLTAGTCVDGLSLNPPIVTVPCATPHRIEVYAVAELAGTYDDAATNAFERCDRAFTETTGYGPGLATVMERLVIRPTETDWAAGDRTVICHVLYPEPMSGRLSSIDPLRAFGLASRFGLVSGDCLVDFKPEAPVFELIDCAAPHEAEVLSTQRLDGPDYQGPDYPGLAELDRLVEDACFGPPFEAFVGVPYDRSTILAYGYRPTVETWAAGDRSIVCVLTDDLFHTGSFAGVGR
jgi:hypothetical protein